MPSSDLSPLAVVQYSKNYLIAFVRHQTGWDQRSEVSDKIQLNYLCNYLEVDHISARTIVVENEYIDRHYLEDYSEYYARCFPSHPRKCSRVHFFSNEFDEYQFTSALESNQKPFIEALSKNYIGFVVIRPIPHTFLAKLCLKRYDELISNAQCKLIAKKIKVSLFGMSLEVESAAFLEQDKVVSACATSALWMFFNASGHVSNGSLPSPSAITKSATGSSHEGARTFPTTGLSPPQVARSLKHFGYEPLIIELGSDWGEFKEIIYGYISSDIPILVAGSIYQKSANDSIKHAGKHLVCALGYRLKENDPAGDEMQLISHRIEKIYVHDDRYGPYVRVSTDPVNFNYDNKELEGLEFSLLDASDTADYFVPDMAIVGVYHKIRLSYFDIRDMCDALYLYLQETKSKFDLLLDQDEDCDNPARKHFRSTCSNIGRFLRGVFDITLTSNTEIKEELRSSKAFITFNGAATKSACLLQSMPKYIWRCRIWKYQDDSPNAQLFTDILFDATEVPQGQIIVGFISYDNGAERVWKHIEQAICGNAWEDYRVDAEAKRGISGFLKFFSKSKNKTYLNTLYGPLGLPRRDLKYGETDNFNNISARSDIQVIRAGNTTFLQTLDKGKRHIWVINEIGDLVLGENISNGDEYQGHPTLVDEKPARIGGELYYAPQADSWVINLRSATYSSHIKRGTELWRGHLESVVRENFRGEVIIEKTEERMK
ncbi:MAG: hypothetical protein K8H84_00665 [Sulfuricella denitrificans]|nr:hypothetical protein [Sulfuricella denitrificans]